MRDSVYLVFGSQGIDRMTRRAPELGAGEHAVRVRLEVPDSVFRPNPMPDAVLKVPERAVLSPTLEVMTAEPPAAPALAPAAAVKVAAVKV